MIITITSGQSNLTRRPHRTSTVQWYSPGSASVHSTYYYYMHPWAHPSPTTQMASRSGQPFLHSSRHSVVWHARARPSAKKLPLGMGRSEPHNAWFLGPPESKPKRHLDRFSRFCTAHGRESLYFTTGRPFSPLKLPLSTGGSKPPANTRLLGHTRVLNQNDTSVGFSRLSLLASHIRDPRNIQLVWFRLFVRGRPFPATLVRPLSCSIVCQFCYSALILFSSS